MPHTTSHTRLQPSRSVTTGTVFWIDGECSADITMLAHGTLERLQRADVNATLLDEQGLRQGLCADLDDSASTCHSLEMTRRMAHIATLLARLGHVCLCACKRTVEQRLLCRAIVGEACQEIFVHSEQGQVRPHASQAGLVLMLERNSLHTSLDSVEAFILQHVHASAPPPFWPQLVVFDFDGVFTDNTVTVDEHGHESVRCHRGDGMGISLLRKSGVEMCILSGESNPVVMARARKLGLSCVQNCADKAAFLRDYLRQKGMDAARMVYVGNDVNDVEAMTLAGYSMAPADAHPTALAAADMVLTARGGHGALRQCCDTLLRARPTEQAE